MYQNNLLLFTKNLPGGEIINTSIIPPSTCQNKMSNTRCHGTTCEISFCKYPHALVSIPNTPIVVTKHTRSVFRESEVNLLNARLITLPMTSEDINVV